MPYAQPASPVGTIVRVPKTAELIATNLRRQIVRGELATGEKLPPELQLMAEFGVSRPTLREALRILEAESLIVMRRGSRGGAQVMTPTVSVAARHVGLLLQIQGTTIDDVYQARMLSEPSCARLLALRRTEQDLADLSQVVEAMKQEVDSRVTFVPDPARWSRLTYRIHELILQRCGNKALAIQGAVLQDIVATHLHSRIEQGSGDADTPAHFQQAILSYEEFIRLLREQDSAGAQKHWLSHMETAAKYLLKDDLKTQSVVDLFV